MGKVTRSADKLCLGAELLPAPLADSALICDRNSAEAVVLISGPAPQSEVKSDNMSYSVEKLLYGSLFLYTFSVHKLIVNNT